MSFGEGIAECTCMLLAIPASSAPAERVFSGAGYIFSQCHRVMKVNSLSSLVFIRENAQD